MFNSKRKEQKARREEALKGFDFLDDRMKLTNPIWHACTSAAHKMGMTEEERMKLIAVNLVKQNGELLDQIIQLNQKAGFVIVPPKKDELS